MPGKTVDSATVEKAKQWCGKAREVLGSGYIPYSEDRQMHLRNEAVASSLKSLATANPGAFQRLGTDYKALSKEAKTAAQNRDADLSRRVSAELELLQLEIKAELSGLSTSEEKQLFEKHSTFALNELKRLAPVADADVLRKAQVRVEGLISDHDKRRDFTAGAAALKLATVDTRQQIQDWTEKLAAWKNDHSRRSLIKTAAEQLSDDSPYRQKIQQLLDAASDVAHRVHDYALAEKFVVQSEQVLREQQDYEAPIRKKMQAFQDGDAAFLELANAVKERLDRVLQSVASKQRERRGPIPPDDAYQVLGEAGHAYLEATQLAEGFRQRVRQNRLEAWGGYPESIELAKQRLERAKLSLDKMLTSSTTLHNATIDLIRAYEQQQRREADLKAWAEEKSTTQGALDRLAACAGPTSPELTAKAKEFQILLDKHDGVKIPFAPQKLKDLTVKINQTITQFTQRREELQKERSTVRDQWNLLLEKQDVFPESYYNGISDEYDQFAIYLDSPNLAVVEIGLQKRRELLLRFEHAIANPTEIKEGAETYEKLKTKLSNAQKDLAAYQPTRLAEHQFTSGELAQVVHTEDPSTLRPKLLEFQTALDDTILRAGQIKTLRQEVSELVEELEPLFERLLEKYEGLGKTVPDEYQSSYEQVAQRHIQFALSLEDVSLAGQHQQRLVEIKANLMKLLTDDVSLGQQFDDVETKHVDAENLRRQQLAQQQLAYEQALADFSDGLYKELNAKLGRMQLATYLGFGDDRLNAVNTTLAQAKKAATAGDYLTAMETLRTAVAMSRSLIDKLEPGQMNDGLKGLGRPWADAILAVNQAAARVVAVIQRDCEAIKLDNPSADTSELLTKVQRFSQVSAGIDGGEFDGYIANILDQRRSDHKSQAEQALQLVRRRTKFAESDPLLLTLSKNPFGVKVPRLALLRALRNLELALVTVQ